MPLKIKVLKWAAVSRLITFIMQVFFNAIIVDHDAGVFRKPRPVAENDLERFFEFLLEGLERWDGQYFLNVAEQGYVYEKSLAFFPLFPLLTRILANSVLLPFQWFVNYHLVLLLAAVSLNFACFTLASLLIFLLGREILNSEQCALKAALLFCYNPASIFFSAAYSESLFSCCVFAGMLFMEKDVQFGATAAFALSALVRSNGTVNAGFLLYSGAILPLILFRTRAPKLSITACCSLIFFGLIRSLVVVASFALFQLYAYEVFCVWPRPILSESVLNLSAQDPYEYVIPGDGTPWCQSRIPISYGYIQSHYWNVGFFRYFEAKQIPNFLLASPAIALCLHGIFRYAIRLLKAFGGSSSPAFERHLRILPYVVHCSFLLVFGITSMHIQVVTRLVTCSSPFLCLFAAATLPDLPSDRRESNDKHRKNRSMSDVVYENVPLASYWSRRKHLKTRSKIVLIYFALYYIVGTACFANYLPWT